MRFLLLLVGVAMASLCLADGSYFIRGSLSPEIPFQRAAVAYRDGIERMAIENTVVSSETEMSWVLPIPVRPISVVAGIDGKHFFTKSESVYRPALQRDNAYGPTWVFYFVMTAPLLWIGLSAPFRLRKEASPWRTLVRETVASLLFALLVMVFTPVYASSRSSSTGIESLMAQEVGDYKVEVVRGESAQPIIDWLQSNGTPLPERAKPIVADYVKRGWCFMAAMLNTDIDRAVEPHPIIVSFKTKEPIYPMRLTSLVPKPLVLDLYVIATGTAMIDGLDMWVSRPAIADQDYFSKPTDEYFSMQELEWKGATLTRFRTKLEPAEMTEDYRIGIAAYRPYHKEVWLAAAVREHAQKRVLFASAAAALLMAYVGLGRNLRVRPWFLATLALMAIAAIAVVAQIYATASVAV